MALDYLAFNRIMELIKESIEGGKITKISQISNEEFLFIIRNNNQNYNLLVSTHPNMSYLNIVNKKPESNQINTNLLMLFRKHLENGRINEITQQNNDRIALVSIVNRDDYYRNTVHKLYIELIGRASNIILTDENNVIIDSLKKIPLEYLNLRTIQPGIKYTLPSKPNEETLPYDLENEINYSNININQIKENVNKSKTIYISTNGNKKNFHFIPLKFMEGEIKEYVWNEGLDEFYHSSLENERHRQFTSEMEKLAKSEIKKSEKKVKKLKEELQNAKDAIIYKYYADLLLTYMQGEKITTDKVEIYDEFEDKKVVIPYDTRYDLYYNTNQYYKKYQKSKVAVVKIQEQIDLCEENIDYFESVKYHLSKADVIAASQIKEELVSLGYFRKYQKPVKNSSKKKSKNVPKVYKPKKFKVDEIIIYAGMNNLQNEYLTFKMADKTHMYFHIQQGPGAHVVVMSNNIDENLKRIAANIAAYYSSYSMSSTVGVNYTLVKNIKKIPGGKPGKVIINNYKTIFVDPDYELVKKYIID
ncbi:MAG: NFACT family protein [Bacilli bacterium]|nr:NFACT family protein [Bacilli bacterium]